MHEKTSVAFRFQFSLTRPNIFTDTTPFLDLLDKHPVHQHPPVDMKDKQRKKKGIEKVVIDWSLEFVFILVQRLDNFIAAQ